MLSKDEQKFINKNIVNYYHLTEYNSHFFGEPFFLNSYLYYFDSSVVTLLIPPLGGAIKQQSLNRTVSEIIRRHAPDNLIIWGETPVTAIANQAGYKLKKKRLPLWKRELVFGTDKFKPGKKYKYLLTKAKKNDLKLNFVKALYYKSEYLKLIANTHDHNLDLKSLSYYCLYPYLEKTKFVEVLKDGKIISINVIIEALPNYVCFAEIGYEKEFNRVSGMSKVLLIKYYLKKAKYISWGGCANEGIYNYKREIIGKTPICFYDNYFWYEFYKNRLAEWWLGRMQAK